ncbi:MAG TPA: AraC family transcriptional regulator [Gemmatimonadaceae bacterium]|jgi:AraC-like DNA-binding protein|nr:AraC family transcriptional regulator [Gemmatimonadaceae bacterium]
MLLLARLSPPMLSHLRIVAGGTHTVLAAPSWPSMAAVLRARPVDIAVVDPCIDGGADTESMRALRVGFPSVAVLVYTAISPDSTRAMLALGELGVRHCILRGFDDEPGRFRDGLELLRAAALEDQVLATLRVPLLAEQAPGSLVSAIEQMFRTPRRFRTAEDIAVAAGMPRRGVNRWLERAGVAPARMLVIGARVLRGYQYAQNPALAVADIAGRLGYPDPRVFSDHVRMMTGRAVSAWRATVAADQCVAMLVAKLMILPPRPAAAPTLTLMRRAAGRR